jgi:microcin C transport system ATP-binding protein
MSLLTVNNLSVTAHENLVNKISFSIEKGEMMALVGESGSGKTLTALAIIGLLPSTLAQGGNVQLADCKVPAKGLDIGMIFQEPMTSLNPLHTIAKQIGEAIEIHQPAMNAQQVVARTQELLDQVGLSHFKDRLDAYPHQLSGGERQRVMIAMAIANNPKLLIADEPTTALDVTIQAQILDLLARLCKETGMSVLLITHDLSIVRRVASRVAIMCKGELVEQGATKTLFAAPQHDYTKKLLAAEPKEDAPRLAANVPSIMECKGLGVSFAMNKGVFSWKAKMTPVLSNVDISVPKGATLGVVGESGSGKTTLALALLRLTPSHGEILFDSNRLDGLTGAPLRAKRKDMQIVFQDPFASLNPRMMIGDIIGEGLGIHELQLSDAQVGARVDAILQEVGLTPIDT